MPPSEQTLDADIIIVGGGLSGMVTALTLLEKNTKVLILERGAPAGLGGLAKDSFGGIMMVDTPLQRKTGIKDSPELALRDWKAVADFGSNDIYPKSWANTYVHLSGSWLYDWLYKLGVRFMPVVNWPERGLFTAGNSIPRWHITWGIGHQLVECVKKAIDTHMSKGNLQIKYFHRVEHFNINNNCASGCSGDVTTDNTPFSATSKHVVVAAGGICGGDLSFLKSNWNSNWPPPPPVLLNGSHPYADGMLHKRISECGGNLTHLDKQWHYPAGIHYPESSEPNKGLSLVPPRSALWVNAKGQRIGPVPLVGNTDTRFLVEQILKQPGQYSWQILNWKIAIKELAVSGCDFMTAFRYQDKVRILRELLFGNKTLVRDLAAKSKDIVIGTTVEELVFKMNEMGNPFDIDGDILTNEIETYDAQINRGAPFYNDDQLRRIQNIRKYRGDRIRTCKFQPILDDKALPLIAIREFILTRKSLGGVQTNLNCQVLTPDGQPIHGLYAVGETAGFGGGGIHGKGSLEGTFLGSCVITGRLAGQHILNGINDAGNIQQL